MINGLSVCAEVNIHGDAVWGVFNTPTKTDIDSVFSVCAKLASLIDILNCRLRQREIDPIKVGIGASYGRALMIKAGYKGSGINEVVWMGDVVNEASKASSSAKKPLWMHHYVCVTHQFFQNLNEDNQSLLNDTSYYGYRSGSVVNISMDDWRKDNCSTD